MARRAQRRQARSFLADGVPSVREALAAAATGDAVVHELWLTESAAERHPGLVDAAARANVPTVRCSEPVMAVLAETVSPQGVLAWCDFVDRPLEALGPDLTTVAVLAAVRDPGNAGSVLRAADAAGADSVMFATGCVDPYNAKAVRASVGSLFHVPLVVDVPMGKALERLRSSGLQVFAADGSGTSDLDLLERSGSLARPTAWLFGNEAWGLPADLLALADQVVAIPIYGRAESLNLATAATLCLYASARAQRAQSIG
jgi:TrmH family RNA methyltransferase